MSLIRDMMPGFELFQPSTAEDAVALLARYGEAVAWSQLPRRGKAHQRGTGIVDWDVQSDPASAGIIATA